MDFVLQFAINLHGKLVSHLKSIAAVLKKVTGTVRWLMMNCFYCYDVDKVIWSCKQYQWQQSLNCSVCIKFLLKVLFPVHLFFIVDKTA